ncbi:GNAT family N-acetyltransferase [Microbacterium sp. ZW T5_56]|uniref:GNAT family N-acetyltransferase n=1 Tax=Microbacterium sp. ZW T5_56 TaxID=3378081 RepID=UPI0038541B08
MRDEPTARRALRSDIDEMTRIVTSAFFDDPVWGPSFPDPSTRPEVASAYWRFMITEALRFSESRVLDEKRDDTEASPLRAVSVWYPPGAEEISPEAHPAYDALIHELLGTEAAAALNRAGAQFVAARPSEPHAYLTLLAVAPEAQGGGYGMALLRSALAEYDAAGIPTYLESSNPANDARYERLGYGPRHIVRLATGASVQTYWRDATPPA